MNNNPELRRMARMARRALSPSQQKDHAERACQTLSTTALFRNARRIAVYLPADGELNTYPLLKKALKYKKKIYLPVLRPATSNSLWFARYINKEPLIKNKYGIAEPDIRKHSPAMIWTLDLIILPLVAFDPNGNRIGMGGGYYDRTLGRLTAMNAMHKPKLIGYAHECQKSDAIITNRWDIPLHGIVTEYKIYNCTR